MFLAPGGAQTPFELMVSRSRQMFYLFSKFENQKCVVGNIGQLKSFESEKNYSLFDWKLKQNFQINFQFFDISNFGFQLRLANHLVDFKFSQCENFPWPTGGFLGIFELWPWTITFLTFILFVTLHRCTTSRISATSWTSATRQKSTTLHTHLRLHRHPLLHSARYSI